MIFYAEVFVGAVVYLVIGVMWSRTQAVRLQARINRAEKYREENKGSRGYYGYTRHDDPWFAKSSSWDTDLMVGLAAHALFWWLSMASRAVLRVLSFVADPVNKQRKQAKSFAEKADDYERIVRDKTNKYDQETLTAFEQIAADYRATAKKLEI